MKIKENGIELSGCEFWGYSPTQVESYEKKENLTSNDIMALSYFAMEFLSENFNYLTRDDIENESSMQNDSLYLGNFEGYYLKEYDLYIRTLEMTTENKIIICCYLDGEPVYFLGY